MKARGIAANSALALAGDVASKAGALVLMVVAARTLSTDELAVLGTALAAAGIAGALLDAGASTLITRDGARGPRERGTLFTALALGRAPAAAILVAGALAAGAVRGETVEWAAAALLGVLSAAALSLIGLFRSVQDMRPEALQKLGAAVTTLVAAAACALLARSADAFLLALVGAAAVSVLPLAWHARRAADFRFGVNPLLALRRAAPLGAMAIATIAYYRSGTLALSALSTPSETASYTVASAVAFGLLMLPNAITTGLLPRIAAERDRAAWLGCARRALMWSLALSLPLAAAVALAGPYCLSLVFGRAYDGAGTPLALLSLGVVLIAYNGVAGTALLASGHIRTLAFQVGCSLAANVAALFVLVPPFGAVGAALATIICELTGAALLTLALTRRLPGLVPASRAASLSPAP